MEGYYYGILDVYYAIMKTEDTATAAPPYDDPAVLAKSIAVPITPAYRAGKLYASNATVRDKKKIDSYGVKLNVDKIPAAVLNANATETDKAIAWAVENDLLKAAKSNGETYEATDPVSRTEVIKAWNQVQAFKK